MVGVWFKETTLEARRSFTAPNEREDTQKLLKSRCTERGKEKNRRKEVQRCGCVCVCVCVRRVELEQHCGWINTAAH